MNDEIDVAVIGAGAVGLAVASYVAEKGKDVLLIEKHDAFGRETSSRNSEVIHSGIYYPQNTLKARFCVKGREMLYELCAKNAIPHKKVGKYIVACSDKEVPELEKLKRNAERNGVHDLRMISKAEFHEQEPAVSAEAALLSPSTGIIDSHSLMAYYSRNARDKGALLQYNAEVVGITKKNSGYAVEVKEQDGTFDFCAKTVVNCAGLSSDRVASLAGIDLDKAGYRLHYCKGEYFGLKGCYQNKVKHLVYPVPHLASGGLGVHITIDLQGCIRLGPNAFYTDTIDYTVDPSHKEPFFNSARTFLPSLSPDDLEPFMAGMRPKLSKPGEEFRDFVIAHEDDKGLRGFINLIGIESPGLTSSPAIGEYVAEMVQKI